MTMFCKRIAVLAEPTLRLARLSNVNAYAEGSAALERPPVTVTLSTGSTVGESD